MKRLVRFFEIWDIFGPWCKYTWMTLFPPYRGWDVGCGYCALEEDAMKARRCDRAKEFGYEKCGTTKKPNVTEQARPKASPASAGSPGGPTC
jgi:hypothetical protein